VIETRQPRIWGRRIALGAAALLLQAAPAPVPAHDAPYRAAPVRAAAAPAAAPAPAPEVVLAKPRADPTRAQMFADYPLKRELPIDHLLHPGEFAWNDEGVAPGRPLVVVNLKAQLLSVYRSGIEIGRARIIYGADNMPTPTGTFPILQKDADHVSNLYDAPMPFMLRLTMDGISIHASKIAANYATHGCIGLPQEFAELLFANVKVGDKVVVWAG
jgi:lipoprotein-anchoring transpeptidase ErfK/SrfK